MMEMYKVMSKGSRLRLLIINKAINLNKMVGQQLKLRKSIKKQSKYSFFIQVLSNR